MINKNINTYKISLVDINDNCIKIYYHHAYHHYNLLIIVTTSNNITISRDDFIWLLYYSSL